MLESDLMAVLGEESQPVEEPEAPALTVVTHQTVSPIQVQWERWKPAFAEAMAHSFHDIQDLERKIGQGRAYLFPGKNAAVVAEKAEYSGETVFQALWSVGDMEEVLDLAPGIEAFGRLIGCSSMLVEGRRGWEKVLKPHGYEFFSVTMRKAL